MHGLIISNTSLHGNLYCKQKELTRSAHEMQEMTMPIDFITSWQNVELRYDSVFIRKWLLDRMFYASFNFWHDTVRASNVILLHKCT